jgi:multiple sugar transport system substrate-binding protein
MYITKEMQMSVAKNEQRNQLSRRNMLKLMGGTAGMMALAACAAPGVAPAAPGEGAPAAAPITLTVQHRREYFAEMETLFAEAVQDWGAENNVSMDVSTVGAEAFEDFVAKLYAAVEAGNPPDLVYHVRLVQQLYFLDALIPLDDAVAEAESLYGPAPYGQRSQSFIDGNWYAIPYTMHGGGKFTRQDKFEEVGIDPGSDIVTWDDLREACREVTNPAEEFYGWGATVNRSGDGQGLVVDVIQNWGGQITDADMTQLTFNSDQTVAAVEWLTELFTAEEWADTLPPGIMSWTDPTNNEYWLAGTIGYTSNAASLYAQSKADGNPIYDVTTMIENPIGPHGERLTGGSGGAFVVPRGAEHVDEAIALSLHLITPEIFLPISLISAGLFLPAYEGYYEMDEVVSAFADDANLARMGQNSLGDHQGISWPAEPTPFHDAIQAESILTDMLALTIAQGVSPEDAVAQAEERMARIADEMGAFG